LTKKKQDEKKDRLNRIKEELKKVKKSKKAKQREFNDMKGDDTKESIKKATKKKTVRFA